MRPRLRDICAKIPIRYHFFEDTFTIDKNSEKGYNIGKIKQCLLNMDVHCDKLRIGQVLGLRSSEGHRSHTARKVVRLSDGLMAFADGDLRASSFDPNKGRSPNCPENKERKKML